MSKGKSQLPATLDNNYFFKVEALKSKVSLPHHLVVQTELKVVKKKEKAEAVEFYHVISPPFGFHGKTVGKW